MNKQEKAEYNRKWNKAHSEEIRERNKRYRERNHEKCLEYNRAYYKSHRDELCAKAKAKRIERPEYGHFLWHKDHEKNKTKHRNYYIVKYRQRIIKILGGKCVKCGFDDWRGMQIDHINGGGSKEIRNKRSLKQYYQMIEESFNNKENKYQLLCANCNRIKVYENKENTGRIYHK